MFVKELLHGAFGVEADDGVVVAAHAGVGLIGGAAFEDAAIGCGDVGVAAYDGADTAIKMDAHSHFLRGRFGVHIDEYGIDIGAEFVGSEGVVGAVEGRVEVFFMKHLAQQVEDEQFFAAADGEDACTGARDGGGVVVRAQELLLAGEHGHGLFLIEDVVATGEDIDAGTGEFTEDVGGDAEAACSVIDIDDDGVEIMLGAEFRDLVEDCIATGAAYDVATEKEFHGSLGVRG